MGAAFGSALQQTQDFIGSRPDLFERNLSARDTFEKLRQVNPSLFNEVRGTFNREIEENEDFYNWLARTGGAYVHPFVLEKLPAPPQPPPGPTEGELREGLIQKEVQKRLEADLAQKTGLIYDQIRRAGEQKIGDQFADARKKAVAEEAALGRLRSPVSIGTLSKIDQGKQNALGQFYANLGAQQAAQQFDLAKALESIQIGERRAGEQVNQFGQTLGFQRESRDKGFDLQRELARHEANTLEDLKKPGPLDYVNTAFQGLGALGSLGSLFGGSKKNKKQR